MPFLSVKVPQELLLLLDTQVPTSTPARASGNLPSGPAKLLLSR